VALGYCQPVLSLWVANKPTKRTFKMVCLFFAGQASEQEVIAPIEKLHEQPLNSSEHSSCRPLLEPCCLFVLNLQEKSVTDEG
jgi:hypothetical protein